MCKPPPNSPYKFKGNYTDFPETFEKLILVDEKTDVEKKLICKVEFFVLQNIPCLDLNKSF